ncbi:Gfo/Idh/MocA family protein [Streptomyces mirabilis]|uniref:Gfo/Idh/MocA family protein n=1 Tax=Streptomyces mirabilis TaxID=68239 RepID=UPI00364C7047
MLSTSVLGSGWIGGATYDDNYAYVLDATSGATLLSIPFGHSVDALTMVLGEFREVSALVENLRPEVTNVTSGAVAAKSAEDQIAVTGVLESGAVAAMHFRGGTSRATAFHWEINGTEGDLVVKADRAQWWYGGTQLYGARGEEGALTELPVPARYQRSLTQWTGRSAEPACSVAHEYALLRDQIIGSLAPDEDGVPDFRHAVRRQVLAEDAFAPWMVQSHESARQPHALAEDPEAFRDWATKAAISCGRQLKPAASQPRITGCCSSRMPTPSRVHGSWWLSGAALRATVVRSAGTAGSGGSPQFHAADQLITVEAGGGVPPHRFHHRRHS